MSSSRAWGLFGLYVRALAKQHFSGHKASATWGLERVDAADPGFRFLETAQELIAQGPAGLTFTLA